jgi:hypothetical protein
MNAIAVAAVDGPNVHHLLKDMYPHDRVDYAKMREYLRSDADKRLGKSYDVEFAVLMQGQAVNSMTPSSVSARMTFVEYLTSAGWLVVEKDPPETYPFELIDANIMLANALVVPAQIVRDEMNGLAKLFEADASCELSSKTRENLRDAVTDLRVYRQMFTTRQWLALRASTSLMLATMNRPRVRRALVKLLFRAYGAVAEAQTKQDAYFEGIRSALIHYFESVDSWKGVDRKFLETREPQELLQMARRVEKEQSRALTKLRLERDVDSLLSEWVLGKVKPDLTKPPRHPAVTYLVGSDYRNFLPLAERMKRYGAQPVFVTFKGQLDRASPKTRQEVNAYPCIWLEQFLTGSSANSRKNGLVA